MIGLCFFALPFTYFYAEEALESEDELGLNYGSGDDEDYGDMHTSNTDTGTHKSSQQSCLGKFMENSNKALRSTVSSIYLSQKFNTYLSPIVGIRYVFCILNIIELRVIKDKVRSVEFK